ncbi:hypothetical protein MPTK1_5g12070 [Marchantia polymorpha subsp. ruderalis]|uniref:Uncharacterized protein n=2 Tax=Marchantia polymorpha TaxID=3197 RepID=A0AAF6BHH8_MARPO|nr:hypothetical protein MARPO_0143s0036 [Marchantia polymorpha]BBN11462.1 hypothetical protein Mp_5g12070 [Marchantia polymorpha subsp. ruderalis]|eukprot:PTQ29361.1 hypothetical protein MARPO_0143s0036 [Marchantia polymorpha]
MVSTNNIKYSLIGNRSERRRNSRTKNTSSEELEDVHTDRSLGGKIPRSHIYEDKPPIPSIPPHYELEARGGPTVAPKALYKAAPTSEEFEGGGGGGKEGRTTERSNGLSDAIANRSSVCRSVLAGQKGPRRPGRAQCESQRRADSLGWLAGPALPTCCGRSIHRFLQCSFKDSGKEGRKAMSGDSRIPHMQPRGQREAGRQVTRKFAIISEQED